LANQTLTNQEITFESLDVLTNKICVISQMDRDYEKEFGKKGNKIGDTLYVRKPARFIGRDGAAYNPEGLTDTEVPITINQQSGVDFEFGSAEKFESLDDLKRRYLEKAMASMSNKLDSRAAFMMMQNTANFVGTVGTTPGLSGTDAFQIYTQAGQKLDEMGFPANSNSGKNGNRNLIITSAAKTGWNTFIRPQFNPQNFVGKMFKTGQVDDAIGYQWMPTQITPQQVIGTLGGTPAVNGANQTGTSLITNGWTASVAGLLNIGDNITIAGVFAVNPQTRLSTGALQDFDVQAVAASDGSGNSTVTISPAIVPSGQFQNVTNSPASGSLISVYHVAAAGQSALSGVTTGQGILWTPEAFAWVSFPGDVPEGVDMGSTMMYTDHDDSGEFPVELRFARIWDGYRDQWVNRFDVYYGMGPLYSEGSVRIALS
jgi:hypothetical protein